MPFIQGEQSMDWRSSVPQRQWDSLSEGYWTRSGFYRVSRNNQKTGQDWLRGWGFPCKASKSHFLGKVKGTQAEWED